MTDPRPDIFGNVHKGIRKALCDACVALGRAGDDPERTAQARTLLRDALRFVAHHGDNEDSLLLPLLASRAPELAERIGRAHRELELPLRALSEAAPGASTGALYLEACAFMSAYFEHMREEEQSHDPAIRSVLTDDELRDFGRRSVERTAYADQRMMLGFMLPAIAQADADALLARLPSQLAQELCAAISRAG